LDLFFVFFFTQNPNDVDTLVNLVALYQHMGKSKEVINRYLKYTSRSLCSPPITITIIIIVVAHVACLSTSQAKARTPKHPYVKELELLEQSWERLVSRFSPTQAS
jgi:hypothetical protein